MNEVVGLRAKEARKYGMIWFGAAISLAEIEAGLYCGGHAIALVTGHLLGGVLLYFAGLMGARLHRNGMECTRGAFGLWGMRFFASANILQLVGWTAVMIAQGTRAASGMLPACPQWLLAAVLGGLVILWTTAGIRSFSRCAAVAMLLLLALVALLSVRIFQMPAAAPSEGIQTSFWEVFELSLAMPLSWLPLISDYTMDAKSPRLACGVSAIVYVLGSLWMYFLGCGLAAVGVENVSQGILRTHLGIGGLLVVLLSTVTTTCLDAYSAGESAKSIWPRVSPRVIAAAACVAGVALAILGIMERYTDFLYLISSLFVPMAVAMLTDHFVTHAHHASGNLLAFLAGFAAYHSDLHWHFSPVGPSLTAIVVTMTVALCTSYFGKADGV